MASDNNIAAQFGDSQPTQSSSGLTSGISANDAQTLAQETRLLQALGRQPQDQVTKTTEASLLTGMAHILMDGSGSGSSEHSGPATDDQLANDLARIFGSNQGSIFGGTSGTSLPGLNNLGQGDGSDYSGLGFQNNNNGFPGLDTSGYGSSGSNGFLNGLPGLSSDQFNPDDFGGDDLSGLSGIDGSGSSSNGINNNFGLGGLGGFGLQQPSSSVFNPPHHFDPNQTFMTPPGGNNNANAYMPPAVNAARTLPMQYGSMNFGSNGQATGSVNGTTLQPINDMSRSHTDLFDADSSIPNGFRIGNGVGYSNDGKLHNQSFYGTVNGSNFKVSIDKDTHKQTVTVDGQVVQPGSSRNGVNVDPDGKVHLQGYNDQTGAKVDATITADADGNGLSLGINARGVHSGGALTQEVMAQAREQAHVGIGSAATTAGQATDQSAGNVQQPAATTGTSSASSGNAATHQPGTVNGTYNDAQVGGSGSLYQDAKGGFVIVPDAGTSLSVSGTTTATSGNTGSGSDIDTSKLTSIGRITGGDHFAGSFTVSTTSSGAMVIDPTSGSTVTHAGGEH